MIATHAIDQRQPQGSLCANAFVAIKSANAVNASVLWLILVFGELLKSIDESGRLLQESVQEVVQDADHAPVSFAGGTRNHLHQ